MCAFEAMVAVAEKRLEQIHEGITDQVCGIADSGFKEDSTFSLLDSEPKSDDGNEDLVSVHEAWAKDDKAVWPAPKRVFQPTVKTGIPGPPPYPPPKRARMDASRNWGSPQQPLSDFTGTWHISYCGVHHPDGRKYIIDKEWLVRISKKRRVLLVPAGSRDDVRQDPNYNYKGTYCLNDVHREGTWEYAWIEGRRLVLHHFSEADKKISPFGSPNFYGVGEGILDGELEMLEDYPKESLPKGNKASANGSWEDSVEEDSWHGSPRIPKPLTSRPKAYIPVPKASHQPKLRGSIGVTVAKQKILSQA